MLPTIATIATVVLVVAVGLLAFDRFFPHQAAHAAIGFLRWFSRLHEKRASIPSAEVAYLEGGPKEAEAILLIHGIGADKDNFTETARLLTRRHRVIAVDLPGFGDSSRDPNASYAIPDQVENVHAFAQAIGLSRFHLGGSSMGGQIAVGYARKYPDDVRSLWLLAPAGMMSATPSEVWVAYRDTGKVLLFVENARDFPEVVRIATAKPPFMPGCVIRTLGERGARDFALHMRIFRQMVESPPLEETARGLKTPALIVWGERDRVLDASGAPLLQARMPNSKLIVMPRIGHLPMMEAPRKAAKRYLEFIDSLRQGSAA